MIKRKSKQYVAILLTFLLLIPNAFLGTVHADAASKITDRGEQQRKNIAATFDPDEEVRVIVQLEGEPAIQYATEKGVLYKDLATSKKTQLQSTIKKEQSTFLAKVKEKKINFKVENTFSTVVNGVSGNIKAGKVAELESLPTVSGVYFANEYERPVVTPDMTTSKDMVGTKSTWASGYDGTGTVVGIIDTGIDPTHKDMILSDATKARLTEESVGSSISQNSLVGSYYTAKVPYGYNYYDKNKEIRDLGPGASMHGMHVGGTVGANGDEENGGIKGVSPETQLLALKVFGNDAAMPSTWGDIYIKAIDDGIILGADVLNMSLGSTGGFVNGNDLEQLAIQRATDNGVLMSISAGNSAQFSDGWYNPYAANPDIGLVGSPSVSTSSLSVASIENTNISLEELKITIAGEELSIAYKTQDSPLPTDVFNPTDELEVVYVGDGSEAQYSDKDVTGKVVFAIRTEANPNYGEIQTMAESKGAIGVIIRGREVHGDYVSMAMNTPQIPIVSLSIADGNLLESKIVAAGGEATGSFTGEPKLVANNEAGKMSTFSSWGVTPSLELKPEMTAPGGKIYSTLNDDKYGVMSGTSMAAPHASGGSALVLQKVKELFPSLTGAAKVNRAKALLMNTAVAVMDQDSNQPYSPRRQGAGLMQLYAATTTPVYVVNKGTENAKVELKEISSDDFTMTLTATNFSDKAVTYDVSANVLTDDTFLDEDTGKQTNALMAKAISDATITIAQPTVTIGAGQSVDIEVNVDLSDAKSELEAIFENGYFVEGFITLTDPSADDKAAPALSVPYVGFKGDWNAAPILDSMIYDEGMAEAFYQTSFMTDKTGNLEYGYNPFTGEYKASTIAISPNGDGKNDTIAPVLSFLRNAQKVEYSIVDSDGNVLRRLRTEYEQVKNYFADNPYTFNPTYTTWDGYVKNVPAKEGLYFYQIKTYLHFDGKEPQVVQVPIRVDLTAPVVSNVEIDQANGLLTFDAKDVGNGSGVYALTVDIDGKKLATIDATSKTTFSLPVAGITKASTIIIEAVDFAGNRGEWSNVTHGGDVTAPQIISEVPEALGVYDTRQVPVSGAFIDESPMKYVRVSGDKIVGSSVDLKLDQEKKTFSGNITFTEDGVHEIYFESEDANGNKSAEFRRIVIVDTEEATIAVSGLPANHTVSTDPTIDISVADNFDDIRLLVDGSEEFTNTFKEPYEQRAFSKVIPVKLSLDPGENDVVITVVDLAGHVTTKTITIYKEETPPVKQPSAPVVDKVKETAPKVTGKADVDSIITVKAGSTVLGTAKVDKKGKFSVSIKKQKAGTVLSVTATDNVGTVSQATNVTVEKK